MATCALCGDEKESTVMLQVTPATWNSFHSFAQICGECQESRRFKMWAKPKARAAAAAGAAAAAAAQETTTPQSVSVLITDRRTGALLHAVEGSTLAGADLSGTTLPAAALQQAGLRGTVFQRADLHLADLRGADLRGADLRAANFRGADLRGSDLRDARLHRADLNHCLYDTETQWPAGFDPRTSGAVKGMRHD